MLDRHLSPTTARRPATLLIAFLVTWAGAGVAPPAANAVPSTPSEGAAHTGKTGKTGRAGNSASVGDCGNLTFSGSAFGYLENGTLTAGFCVGPRSVRRINVSYDKTEGISTNIRLGFQQTNRSGVGIGRPVYAPPLTAISGNISFKSFYLALPQGCYHGVMLNTATRYQYVTKVWGEC
ncbi:hypothetical protein [Streptosporangium sp. NPDC051022]|uniref:hypothetical protein n=1 Tax=Streptosporangium sp. NPDC051022 TaxID=3155752 RepID=UPI0034278F91